MDYGDIHPWISSCDQHHAICLATKHNISVCVGDVDNVSLLTAKSALASRLWKQVRSN